MKDDCIFCKLANGVFPTNSIYEDEDFNVILDAGPASRGHALILPKEHYENFYELPEELAVKVIKLAKKLVTELAPKLGVDGYNVVQNNGAAAGQTVMHYHMHLIPRYEGDDAQFGWKVHELSEEAAAEIMDAVK